MTEGRRPDPIDTSPLPSAPGLPRAGRAEVFLGVALRSAESGCQSTTLPVANWRVGRFVVFAATNSDQYAEEEASLNHGVFTYSVIGGLMGEAEDKTRRACSRPRLLRQQGGRSAHQRPPDAGLLFWYWQRGACAVLSPSGDAVRDQPGRVGLVRPFSP